MKKLFILCLTICLLSFTVLASDVDLSSNLTFAFEPSATLEKSLVLVPFANFDLSLSQDEKEPVEKIKKNDLFPIPAVFGIMLVVLFSLNMSMGASI